MLVRDRGRDRRQVPRRGRPAGRDRARGSRRIKAEVARNRERCSRPAASTSSAPNATRAGASTTSCAAAPAARATRRLQFFLSLEDDLMRIFGKKRCSTGSEEGHGRRRGAHPPWLNKALKRRKAKVEARNFEIRKNLLRFDDVAEQPAQGGLQRAHQAGGHRGRLTETVAGMRRRHRRLVSKPSPRTSYSEQWKVGELKDEVQRIFASICRSTPGRRRGHRRRGDQDAPERVPADRLFAQRAAQFRAEIWRRSRRAC